MDWKQLLGSITTSVDEGLPLRNAYLVAQLNLDIIGLPLCADEETPLADCSPGCRVAESMMWQRS